jgi:photosystem II stability/assembly factor-like uncharacterized protein
VRTLDERVAELEALFEEARRRARRRRQRNTALVLLGLLAGLAAAYAGGHGVRTETAVSGLSSAQPAAQPQKIGRWSLPSGPASGVATVVVDPRNSAIVYAAAGGRVYRSTDGGRTWTGGLQIDPRVDALAIDPQRPSVLYAGTGAGVFKSVDAGRSWVFSGLGQTPRLPGGPRGEGNVGTIVVDPSDSNVVYAVAGFAVDGSHVSKSTDAGRTWRTLSTSPGYVSDLTIDPAKPQTLYAAAWPAPTPPPESTQGTIAMSTDGGATWRTVLANDGEIWAIVADPASPGAVYALGTAGILVSADGGQTWQLASKAPASYLTTLVPDPQDPKTLYLSTWRSGVFRTSDAGRTWSALGATLGAPIAIDPRAPSTLYAGRGNTLVKTADGGTTWQPAGTGIVSSDVLSTATDPRNDRVVYAATDAGLIRSGNRGRAWATLRPGVGQAIAVDPSNSAHLLASGPRGIVMSTDGGRTWSSAAGSVTGDAKRSHKDGWGQVSAIVFDPHHPRTVFAAEFGAGLITSTDGGRVWRQAANRPAWISTIVADPLGSGTLYTNFDGGLLRSPDEGSSWHWSFFHSVGALMGILAVDPTHPQTLYGLFGDSAKRTLPLHLAVSVDGGSHWRLMKEGRRHIDATALAIDPRDSNTMYAGLRFGGILRTTDGGATWRPFDTGLLARAITTLSFDRSGDTLYAGTDSVGVVEVRLR